MFSLFKKIKGWRKRVTLDGQHDLSFPDLTAHIITHNITPPVSVCKLVWFSKLDPVKNNIMLHIITDFKNY